MCESASDTGCESISLVVDVGVGCHVLLPLGAGSSGNPAATNDICSVTRSYIDVGREPELAVVLSGALDYCLRHPVLSQRGLAHSWFSLSWHNCSCGIADSVSLSVGASDAVGGAFRQLGFQMTSTITQEWA